MSDVVEYENIIMFHIDYYVTGNIDGAVKKTMVHKIKIDLEMQEQLLDGQISAFDDLAYKLSFPTGTSTECWLNLQKRFNDNLMIIKDKKI